MRKPRRSLVLCAFTRSQRESTLYTFFDAADSLSVPFVLAIGRGDAAEDRTMATTLRKEAVYVGSESLRLKDYRIVPTFSERVHVLGHEFGPCMLAAGCSLEEALSEWDERYGERVDVVADAAALASYGRETLDGNIERAMIDGDIRVNDGGTMVWVSHYEWCRSFRTVREAGRFFRTGGN